MAGGETVNRKPTTRKIGSSRILTLTYLTAMAMMGKRKHEGKIILPTMDPNNNLLWLTVLGKTSSDGYKLEPVSYTHLDVYKRQPYM